jgi:hypothetical protein
VISADHCVVDMVDDRVIINAWESPRRDVATHDASAFADVTAFARSIAAALFEFRGTLGAQPGLRGDHFGIVVLLGNPTP